MFEDDLDPVWRALGSPLRRRILDLLRDGPRTTGDLAASVPEVSRFAVMQHLDVLAEADLVLVRREGRERWNHLNAVPIRRIHDRWVSRYSGLWAAELELLRLRAETPPVRGRRSARPRTARTTTARTTTARTTSTTESGRNR
jgi:DNA-binding transcriptional ArsR family regulator